MRGLVIIATLSMVGCASTGTGRILVPRTANGNVVGEVDTGKMAAVEAEARAVGVRVVWINAPTRQ